MRTDNLKQTLDELKRQRVKYYTILNYTLDDARANDPLFIAGAYVYVLTLDGTAKIRLNEISSDEIDLFKYRQIASPFYRIFLTHTAQAGKTLSIAIGVGAEVFSLQDFQSPDLSLMSGYMFDLRNSLAYNFGAQVSKSVVASVATVILHTVSAGKILLLESYLFANIGSPATSRMFVRDASDVEVYTLAHLQSVSGTPVNQLILSIPEGYDICVATNADAMAYIKGREI